MSRHPLRATYRLQLQAGVLDFAQAAELLPYLDDLGVSHLYLSPCWQAREGSTHGYDVVDPAKVSDALGGEEGLRALAAAAHERGMGLVLDVVPNHMATDDANPYWADEERRRTFFDVDEATGKHRRFFDVDELAGVRQEDPEVFAATHAKVLELVREGVVDGLRIDHPDGLADPEGYLRDLRDGGAEHVWVEKILETGHGERLRDWPVEGTVGYEFAADLNALLCDPAGEGPITELWQSLTGDADDFHAVAAQGKREQAATTFQPELERLRRVLAVEGDEEAVAALPVYRTYVDPHARTVADEDREAAAGLPEEVRARLLLEREAPAEWVVRFQQATGPVMAKGVEDTAFYRYLRFVALNEVGGDPACWTKPVEEFHRANVERATRFPHNLLVATTHDTKRSADVRARLLALSGFAKDWCAAVRSWVEVNGPLKADGGPTPAEELLVYQTLLGAWPIEHERVEEYLVKALREGKTTTSWIEPDEDHEQAVIAFARALRDHGPFRYGFDGYVARASEVGERLSLAATLLRLTVPGLPDVYQGDELWALSLVDPDNRRPVDWEARRAALDALKGGAEPTRETAKLHVVWRTLDLRRRRPEAFAGDYTPIPAPDDVCAYLRGSDVLVAVGVRDAATGAGGWTLPAEATGRWRDVLGSGGEVDLPDGVTLAGVLGPDGRALLERVA
ncbi:malto-oligosyltrehalose synthase [Conexibacter sp. SYSU D00693]|uniref:malto-oligosyltrehalose synthase n=1 Tax=Conexibacter sp. SYSU D00693 TaxID=2812560 RepID=UPI00196A48AF|nr:malto-oligosyltrehalose synthase [Conexibacter sp. SYSU D00693]